MPSEESKARKKLPLIKLSILAAAVVVGALLVLRGVNYRALMEQGMAVIRAAGPWAFFAGIVVLPAIGAPLTAFTVTSGEAFAPQMTLTGVIVAVMASIAVNLALTYWLARFALRPLLSRLAERYGYKVPRVTPATALSVALVVRLTPGPPFFMQSYILGLAEVPFRLYMIVSWLSILPWAVGGVVLGKGIFDGHFKQVAVGVGVLIVASALVHWIRKRYAAARLD
jgi:uncharacterized membrane protein YdjX (TVP38/TMEM64 family)